MAKEDGEYVWMCDRRFFGEDVGGWSTWSRWRLVAVMCIVPLNTNEVTGAQVESMSHALPLPSPAATTIPSPGPLPPESRSPAIANAGARAALIHRGKIESGMYDRATAIVPAYVGGCCV